MKHPNLFLLPLFMSCMALADEPGYLRNETLPDPAPIMTTEFRQARGLTEWEVRSLHYNRVTCSRRLFSPAGHSIEGDGDLKVTRIGADYLEAEFPSHFDFYSFGAESPYRHKVTDGDTVTSRRLINAQRWQDGQSLKIEKSVRVNFSDRERQPQVVPALAEVRVSPEGYPKMFLIREVIFTQPNFVLYYICD